jgi:hypothetical protein
VEVAVEASAECEGLDSDGPRIEFIRVSEMDEGVRNFVKLAAVTSRIASVSVRPDTSPLIRGSFPWKR